MVNSYGIEDALEKATFTKLRNTGELLTLSDRHNGKNCPDNKTLLKIAISSITAIRWNPIGQWDTLDSGVMRLSSRQCGCWIIHGKVKTQLNFTQGDLRYTTDDFFTSYIAQHPKTSEID